MDAFSNRTALLQWQDERHRLTFFLKMCKRFLVTALISSYKIFSGKPSINCNIYRKLLACKCLMKFRLASMPVWGHSITIWVEAAVPRSSSAPEFTVSWLFWLCKKNRATLTARWVETVSKLSTDVHGEYMLEAPVISAWLWRLYFHVI